MTEVSLLWGPEFYCHNVNGITFSMVLNLSLGIFLTEVK